MTLRVVVADDEPAGRQRLVRMLKAEPDITVLKACSNGVRAVEAIRMHHPDVAFLDIRMPALDGFGVVEALTCQEPPAFIFVTAYDEYAVHAFEVNALDYLLKPFDQARLSAALLRVRERPASPRADVNQRVLSLLEQLKALQDHGLDRLVIRTPERAFFLKAETIDWIEAAGNYVHLHVGKTMHLLRESIVRLERQLDPARFVRISRSAIVNIDRIEQIQPWFQGDRVLILYDRTRLTSTRGYRRNLQQLLGR